MEINMRGTQNPLYPVPDAGGALLFLNDLTVYPNVSQAEVLFYVLQYWCGLP